MTNIEQMIQDMCPNGVEFKPLGEVMRTLPKGTLKTTDLTAEGYPVINSGKSLYGYYSQYNNDCEAITIAARGEYAGWISYFNEKFWAGGLCYPYTSKNEDILKTKFLYYWLKREENNIMESLVARGSIPALNKSDLDKLEIPLPPLEIQKIIVECLDKFSALAAELQAELQKRRTQYEYYRTRLLTPPPSENISSDNSTDESKWEWKTLGEVCKFQNGFAFQSSKFLPSGKPILRITNIKDSQIDDSSLVYFNEEDYPVNLDSYKILPNRIVIAMSGATTGKVGMNRTEQIYYMNQRVGMFIPDELIIDNNYLFHYLSSQTETLYYLAGGGAQPNLSTKAINELQIPLPSLTEQKRIAELLNKLSTLTTSLSDGIPAEQAAQQKRYEYYRDLLLTFPRKDV